MASWFSKQANHYGYSIRNALGMVAGMTYRSNTKKVSDFKFEDPDPVTYEFKWGSLKTKIHLPAPTDEHPYCWQSEKYYHKYSTSCETIRVCSGGEITVTQEGKTHLRNGKPEEEIRLRPKQTHVVNPFTLVSFHAHVVNVFGLNLNPHVEVVLKHGGQTDQLSNQLSNQLADEFDEFDQLTDEQLAARRMLQFYHTVCSVILDKDIFCQLKTTPPAIRSFYNRTYPFIQQFMAALFLNIQLRVIYVKNDYWPYAGRIPFTFLWRSLGLKAPMWAVNLEMGTIKLLAQLMNYMCYLIGTQYLGMKAEYDEYNYEFD